MLYETAIIILLAIICFLLYKLYTINYTRGRGKTDFIPANLRKDLENLEEDGNKISESRLKDVNSKIFELEKRVEKNESVVEKLIEELG
jgi:hypothetical protein